MPQKLEKITENSKNISVKVEYADNLPEEKPELKETLPVISPEAAEQTAKATITEDKELTLVIALPAAEKNAGEKPAVTEATLLIPV